MVLKHQERNKKFFLCKKIKIINKHDAGVSNVKISCGFRVLEKAKGSMKQMTAATILDEEKIKKQAKAIMDEFIKALDKVGEISGEIGLERQETTREGAAKKAGGDFKERMLKNAPRKEDGYIIAEKKSW